MSSKSSSEPVHMHACGDSLVHPLLPNAIRKISCAGSYMSGRILVNSFLQRGGPSINSYLSMAVDSYWQKYAYWVSHSGACPGKLDRITDRLGIIAKLLKANKT